MRARTAVVGVVVLAALAVVATVALPVGSIADLGRTDQSGGRLTVEWVSTTGTDRAINHHAPAAADGRVFVPLGGEPDTDQCGLVALAGHDGERQWRYPVPPANCTIHAVADPSVADYDDDGTDEVFVATTEQSVVGMDPDRGQVEFRRDLTAYGYTSPIVTDLVGDGSPEVVVVDVQGTVFVLRPDGSTVWTREHGAYTWGQPQVADFDGDGGPELVVGFGESGTMTLFEADGSVAWNRSQPVRGALTWVTTGQADGDDAIEIAVGTTDGVVAVLDGRDGAVQWRRDLGTLAAVHGIGDGDRDGEAELYAVAQDGVLRSYVAATGTEEWSTTLTTDDVQMTPPPVLGDLDGDGRPDLLAPANDGTVSLVDPATGTVTGTYHRDVPIWVHPTLADTDGDGVAEAYVIYGDGRVVALSVADEPVDEPSSPE